MVWLKRITIFLVIVGVGIGVGGTVFFQSLKPVNSSSQSFLYHVTPGTSLSRIAIELQQKNLIRNSDSLRLVARLMKQQDKVQTGYFRLSPNMGSIKILEILVQGKTENFTYTIPEGYRIDRAAANLGKVNLSPKKYIQLANNPTPQLKEKFSFLKGLNSLEGYLFPDTYHLNGSEQALIESQLRRFDELIMPLWKQRPAEHTLSLDDTIKLASIVELEGLLDIELPKIAGVFLKRMKIGMKLESDPTVEYAQGWHQGNNVLSLKDIKIDSPYNSYKYKGLPPTPIGNPGLAAIKAVLFSEKTDYLFFVAKRDGTHAFSKTYREHLAAARKYLSK